MSDKTVNIIEIGPRDGFQNVAQWIATDTKLEIIELIIAAGIKRIQLTSFVSEKAIAQMRDSSLLCEALLPKHKNVEFFALVPNLKGAELAANCGLGEFSYVLSASQTHNMANTRRSIEQSLDELCKIRKDWPEIKLNLDIAMVFGCAFEGIVPYVNVEKIVDKAVDIGVNSINLCDTAGLATPNQVTEVLSRLIERYPQTTYHIHIHDTRNMGMLNSYTALMCGVRNIQTTLGGLGGCPFVPGASGNTATEDFVFMLEKMGWNTGVDFENLMVAAHFLKKKVPGNYSGHQINISS